MPGFFADIIVPKPVGDVFTYHVPDDMAATLRTGMRVIVPFGGRKYYTGIVEGVHTRAPRGYEARDIVSVPDTEPVLRHPQLKLWRWMADYYMCAPGDVMRAALPAGLKVESETNVEVNPDTEECFAELRLTANETCIWQYLSVNGRTQIHKLGKELEIGNIMPAVNRMIEKGAVVVSERLVERFNKKTERCVRLLVPKGDSDALHSAFAAVKKSARQEKLLQTLMAMSGFTKTGTDEPQPVLQSELLEKADANVTILKGLITKGLAERTTRVVSRFAYNGPDGGPLPVLSPAQSKALDEIHKSFKDKAVTLLHGVTSSGKTEIYIHLIDYVLQQGRQALFLVPEIALTTQLTVRLQKVFGNRVIISHSRFNDSQRVEIWQRVLHDAEPCVVIGARSSVFLPFGRLGLVIVDEEHENSYKQMDPTPRYNGRDTAIVLATMHGAKVLLGSATPSVETYFKATTGKYGLVSLAERYAGMRLPDVQVVDMQRARLRRETDGAFATTSLARVRQTVADRRQAIIFHNRRGYAPVARCEHCGYTPRCEHCDVTLTFHKRLGRLVCHYCGNMYDMPPTCPVCKEPQLSIIGYGTERIEDNMETQLPDMRLLRMDLDTTRNKDDYSTLIDTFSAGRADVLIGTQMVTKGLDFDNVSTVVVLDADSVISYPDFRSTERAFNMLEQVSGRAGRRDRPGTVIIQTRTPEHPVLGFVTAHNYTGFYAHELEERRRYCYPPFARIIYIYIKNENRYVADDIAATYAATLRGLLGNRVFGPQEPMVSRVQNLFIRRIMLKVEPQASPTQLRALLKQVYDYMHQQKGRDMRRTVVYYDVDPQ